MEPSPTSWTIARTVLATLGTLLVLIVVAETVANAYAARLSVPPFEIYRYVPYVGSLSMYSPPGVAEHSLPPEGVMQPLPRDGSMGFTPTWGQGVDGERVWMLGGSAVRGGFMRSSPKQKLLLVEKSFGDGSLPSALAKEANDHARSLSVLNFGQPEHNFNQSRILFEEMLHRHRVPSVAVFYVGGGEVAIDGGYVGYPGMYRRTRDRLERRLPSNLLRAELGRESFKLPFLVNYLFNRRVDPLSAVADVDRYDPFVAVKVATSEETVLAAAIADSFAHNVRLLEGVCSEFGVRCFYYWQPLLCFKETLDPHEARIWKGRELRPDRVLEGLSPRVDKTSEAMTERIAEAMTSQNDRFCRRARLTRAAIQANASLAGTDTFADLSTIFEDVSAPIFFDMTHMDEGPVSRQLGHGILARRLFADIYPN